MTTSMNEPALPDDAERDVRRVVLIDGLLALAIAATTVAPLLLYTDVFLIEDSGEVAVAAVTGPGRPSTLSIVVMAMLIAAPLVVRRLWPRLSFAAVLALSVASALPQVVEFTGGASTLLLGMNLPLLLSMFTFSNLLGRRAAVAAGGTAVAAVIAGSVIPYLVHHDANPIYWADFLITVSYVVVPVVLVVIVAQVLREQRLRADAAQRETVMATVNAEIRAASAASEERRRLASELHDIVAHHVNLMVVQAEKGPFVRDADASSHTFTTIAETGRAALGELDRLLGVLRTDGTGAVGAPTTAPLPTVDAVPSLVDAANNAGVGVALRGFDVPAVVDPAVSATVHRIVQECITNVVKHADRTDTASVSVTTEPAGIVIRVANRSAGERVGGRRGHGLDSMRSRIDAFGGSLQIDDDDGWFRVEAVVPITEPVTAVSRAEVPA